MAYDNLIRAGNTSKIIELMLRNGTTGQGATGYLAPWINASYIREGGTRVAVTTVAGTAGDAFSVGKWCEIDSANTPGIYSFHVPNAAIATGSAGVNLFFVATGVINKNVNIRLVAHDVQNSGNLGLTSLPNGSYTANNNSISSGVLNTVIEAGYTLQGVLRLAAALLVGERAGGGSNTLTFKGLDGVTTRVTFAIDGSGNSTSTPTLNIS